MAGYKGYSMSNRAVRAYDEGKMPISKWTKTAILDGVEGYLKSYDNSEHFGKFEGLTKSELKQFLHTDGEWHHTSKYYNRTTFFTIDEDSIDTFCISGEPADHIVRLSGGGYISKVANKEGRCYTIDRAQAREMTEYEANYRVSNNLKFNKKSKKERVK